MEAKTEQGIEAAHAGAAAAGAIVGRAGDRAELVFAGRSGKLSGYSKMKTELDEASGVTGWVLHDLRRSRREPDEGLGIPNDVIQAVLNHAVPGVGGVYMQDEMESKRPRRCRSGRWRWQNRAAGGAGGVMSRKDDDFSVLLINWTGLNARWTRSRPTLPPR